MLILASASPRRRELLALAGLEFDVRPAKADEPPYDGGDPAAYVRSLARLKALACPGAGAGDVIIGADTVVALEGRVLGKPKDAEDAKAMLRELSGKVHSVFTGVCILSPSGEKLFSEETRVEFYPLTEEEIDAYAATGEPLDKAGAYGIQGRGCVLVRGIEGDWCNVVGLPVARVVRELRS